MKLRAIYKGKNYPVEVIDFVNKTITISIWMYYDEDNEGHESESVPMEEVQLIQLQ